MLLYVQDTELPVEREEESGRQILPCPLLDSIPNTISYDRCYYSHVIEQNLLATTPNSVHATAGI